MKVSRPGETAHILAGQSRHDCAGKNSLPLAADDPDPRCTHCCKQTVGGALPKHLVVNSLYRGTENVPALSNNAEARHHD